MYRRIDDFNNDWQKNIEATNKMMKALTDDSLNQKVADGHRTLGRIAWHITQTIPEMCKQTGLKVSGPGEKDPVPQKASQIAEAYEKAAQSLGNAIRKEWDDESLMVEDDLYGERWKRGATLKILIDHEIHHRGQMTILMRQANLTIPGIYGPSKEEWSNYGAQAPEI